MTTAWKPITRWGGRYSVSDAGEIRNNATRHILKPGTNNRGYRICTVTFDGGRYVASVHVLVAEAFIGPRPEGMQVLHGNGVKDDNRVANIRYGTPSENELDKVLHGGNRNANKTHCPAGHEYSEANTHYRRGGRERRCRACARERKRLARATP